MMLVASRIAAVLLVTTFVVAGAAKLIRYSPWRSALSRYRVPLQAQRLIAIGVPVAELAVAIGIVLMSQSVGAAASLFLLALFSAAIVRVVAQEGTRVPCGCFGGDSSRDYRLLLARNAVLCGAAALLLVSGSEGPLVASMDASDAVPIALVGAGAGLVAWLGLQLDALSRGRLR